MTKDILHLDIGNTVTVARAWSQSDTGFRFVGSSASPTPGVSSDGDLTASAQIAYADLKTRLAATEPAFQPDSFLVTVSAAGEPRVVCAGVVRGISGESAKRAALAAGATVTDLIAVDDGRHEYQRVSDLKRQAVSMVVMAGGVDEEILGSGRHQLFNVAKVIAEGLPEGRGGGKKVPLVYAASQEGREEVLRILGDSVDVVWADNVRSRLEEEHLDSARDAVVQVFSNSVRRDPRFSGLGRFGSPVVLPAGHATGVTVERLAQAMNENIMAVTLAGDSVEVFSVIRGVFTRTVTPIRRVQAKDVVKWLPSNKMAHDISENLANWMAHPSTLPSTNEDLAIYLAFQKEAVNLAVAEHAQSAIELRGIHRQRQISETFQIGVQGGETLVKMQRISSVFVTGLLAGLLSPNATMSIVLDALAPVGVTKVYLDTHGLLQIHGLFTDGDIVPTCLPMLKPLGVIVSPGRNEERVTSNWAFLGSRGNLDALPVQHGEVSVVEVPPQDIVEFELHAGSKVDLGDGEGRKYRTTVSGFASVYVDGRPRVVNSSDRAADNLRWYKSLGVFPPDAVSTWGRGRD